MHIRKFPSQCGCVVFHLILGENGEEYFVVKAIETSGVASLSRLLSVERSIRYPIGYRLLAGRIVHSLDPIYSNVHRAYRIDRNRGDRLLCDVDSIRGPRYRANNSPPPCRKCGRCSKKRRRRRTASWYTALSIIYLFERLYERYDFYGGERPMKLKLAKANRLEIIRLERN